jgi:hypothetical protein
MEEKRRNEEEPGSALLHFFGSSSFLPPAKLQVLLSQGHALRPALPQRQLQPQPSMEKK